MSAADDIATIIRNRGAAITQDDITEIEVLLTQISPDLVNDIEGGVWETISLIINDPLYEGDAVLPDYGED